MRMRQVLEGGALVLLLAAGAAPQAACGKVGGLERPAPLIGERAKEDYRAEQAAKAAATRRRANQGANSVADEPDPTDTAPVTKRDLQAPEQRLTPLSQTPLPGTVSDPRGAPPSLTPPNR